MRIRCRSHTMLRILALGAVVLISIFTLPSDWPVESKLVFGEMTNFDPVSNLFRKVNAGIETQIVPSPDKSKIKFESPKNAYCAQRPHHHGQDEALIQTKGLPITVNLKNDHQAFLLLDIPPPPFGKDLLKTDHIVG